MAEKTTQTYANHTRWDPRFHFFLLPVATITIGLSVYDVIRDPGFRSAWYVVLAMAFAIMIFLTRTYALKAQDRVIRLEERLRLQSLAPAEWHTQIYRLTEDQMIGLRFAADDEVLALAKQALEENLNRKQIKQRIKSWRPDYWRV